MGCILAEEAVVKGLTNKEAINHSILLTRLAKYLDPEKGKMAMKLREQLLSSSEGQLPQLCSKSNGFIEEAQKNNSVRFMFKLAGIREDVASFKREVKESIDCLFEPGKPKILCTAKQHISLSEGLSAWRELLNLKDWRLEGLNFSRPLTKAAISILKKRQSGKCDYRQQILAAGTSKGRVSVHVSSTDNSIEDALEEWMVDEGMSERPNRVRLLSDKVRFLGISANKKQFCLLLAEMQTAPTER